MKLAIVNNNLKIGGIQKSLINLLNLIGDRYEIDLILFHKDDELLADLNENVNVIESNLLFRLIGISFAEAKKYGFFVRFLSLFIKSCARLFGRKFVMSLILPFTKEVSKKYDVAISYMQNANDRNMYGSCNEFVLKKMQANIKISYMHADFSLYGGDTKYNRSLLNKFDFVVNVTESCNAIMATMMPELKDKLVVVNNPINYDSLSALSDTDTVTYDKNYFNIITAARLSTEKGHFRVLNIIKKLTIKGYKIKWHIVGDGDCREIIEDEIIRLELKDFVVLYGNQKNPYRFFKNADLFLLPSFQESEGMVIKEAIYLRVPVLSTLTNSTKEVLPTEYGVICENSTDSLEESLELLLTDDKLMKELKQNLEKATLNNDKTFEQFSNLISRTTHYNVMKK